MDDKGGDEHIYLLQEAMGPLKTDSTPGQQNEATPGSRERILSDDAGKKALNQTDAKYSHDGSPLIGRKNR